MPTMVLHLKDWELHDNDGVTFKEVKVTCQLVVLHVKEWELHVNEDVTCKGVKVTC